MISRAVLHGKFLQFAEVVKLGMNKGDRVNKMGWDDI